LLKSVLPVRLKAWDMVSMFRSLLVVAPKVWAPDEGLPRGFLLGDISSPLIEPDLLVGGDVSAWEEMGDLMGEGERLIPADEREVKPGMRIDSRLLAATLLPPCSACTTSANEIKLRRRMSVESKDP